MSADELIAQNRQMRALALAMFPRCRKQLGSFNAVGVSDTGGGSARIKLYNVGLGLGVLVEVVALVDIGTAATSIVSPQSPWNMVSRFRLTDYDNTDRINTTGYGLYLISRRRDAEQDRGAAGLADAYFGALTAAPGNNTVSQPNYIMPKTPVATGTNVELRLMYYLPLAYDPENDLRGAVLMQTALGEMYLNIDFNNVFQAATGVDSVFRTSNSSTVTVNSITVNVWQDYLLLQAVGGQTPLPQLDLLTVYELNEMQTTDNIAVGQGKLISFPNVRSVKSMGLYYVNNGTMAADIGDISRFRLVVNGNNILQENSARSQLVTQRRLLRGTDLPAGTYIFDSSTRPIETAMYGNVQMEVTPSAYTAGVTYMGVVFESMYTKGSALPGMNQSS